MISEEIRATRQRIGLTQGQLAERFGVALNTVSRWENGTSKPEGEGLIRLALRQLEEEAVFQNDAIMQQINQRIEFLQQTKLGLVQLIQQDRMDLEEKSVLPARRRRRKPRRLTIPKPTLESEE